MDFEDFKRDFSDRLRALRNERKISAREMSLELGQNVNYINYIENGRHLPSMQGFYLICEHFGIGPAEFFVSEPKSEKKSDAISVFSSLSERQQRGIAAMVKEFLPMS